MAPLCPRQSTDGSPSLRCSRCAPFPPHPEGSEAPRAPEHYRVTRWGSKRIPRHARPSLEEGFRSRHGSQVWVREASSTTRRSDRERYRYYTESSVPRPCPPRQPGPRRVSHYPVGKPPSRRAARTAAADPGGRMEQALPRRRARGWGHARIYAVGHSRGPHGSWWSCSRRTACRRSWTSARCPARGPTPVQPEPCPGRSRRQASATCTCHGSEGCGARADSPNRAWRNTSFRGYADYMLTDEFARGLEELRSSPRTGPGHHVRGVRALALSPQLVADALYARGVQVLHITSRTAPSPTGSPPSPSSTAVRCSTPRARSPPPPSPRRPLTEPDSPRSAVARPDGLGMLESTGHVTDLLSEEIALPDTWSRIARIPEFVIN